MERVLKDYLSGKNINLYEKIKDLDMDINLRDNFTSEFALNVIEHLIKNVNYGETTTYSEIGNTISSTAYRAIGNVLRKNPIPLIIPCHRVIRKDGKIGGFMGYSNNSDNWQQKFKRHLLEIEQFKD